MEKFQTKRKIGSNNEKEDSEQISEEEIINYASINYPTRKFREEWLKRFSWLRKQNGRAFCVACSNFIVNNVSHLARHSLKKKHIILLERKKSQLKIDDSMSAESSPLHLEIAEQLTEKAKLKIDKRDEKITSVHSISKSFKPHLSDDAATPGKNKATSNFCKSVKRVKSVITKQHEEMCNYEWLGQQVVNYISSIQSEELRNETVFKIQSILRDSKHSDIRFRNPLLLDEENFDIFK